MEEYLCYTYTYYFGDKEIYILRYIDIQRGRYVKYVKPQRNTSSSRKLQKCRYTFSAYQTDIRIPYIHIYARAVFVWMLLVMVDVTSFCYILYQHDLLYYHQFQYYYIIILICIYMCIFMLSAILPSYTKYIINV